MLGTKPKKINILRLNGRYCDLECLTATGTTSQQCKGHDRGPVDGAAPRKRRTGLVGCATFTPRIRCVSCRAAESGRQPIEPPAKGGVVIASRQNLT